MNAAEAAVFLREELNRAQLMTFGRTREEAMRVPTMEELTRDGMFSQEDAEAWIAEWDADAEGARWDRARDRCSALAIGIASCRMMQAIGEATDLPQIDYVHEPDAVGALALMLQAMQTGARATLTLVKDE